MSITRPVFAVSLLVVALAAPRATRADDLDTEIVGGALVGRTDAARDYGIDLEVLYQFAHDVPVFLRARVAGGMADNVVNKPPIHGPMFAGLVGGEGRACMRDKILCFVGGLDLGYEVQGKIDLDGHDHTGMTIGAHAGLDAGSERVRVRVVLDAGLHHDSVFSDPPWAKATDISVGVGYRF
jgi:hypothetical protein